jgi:uncharacterized protein (DUF1697 family)
MRYVALLRGINVGGKHRVEMKKLKSLCEHLGFTEVSTYINSGNLFFNSPEKTVEVKSKLQKSLAREFYFEIPLLVKTKKQIERITSAIPEDWQNDKEYKVDVAYLFEDVDNKGMIDELPFKREFVDMRYVEGAVFWKVKRSEYNKSQLNKIITSKLYKGMTLRNVNTARKLAELG